MAKGIFSKTIDLGGHATTIWSFVPVATQTAVVGLITTVTAYFGFRDMPVATAIFYTIGVLAFGMTFVFLWIRISQMVSVYQRLSIPGMVVASAAIPPPGTKVGGINVQVMLKNDSQVQMFYRIKRTHNMFERIGPTLTDRHDSIIPISPNGGTSGVNFGTVENIPFPDKKKKIIDGVFELEIEYGSEIDELKYLLYYKANMQVAFSPVPGSPKYEIASGVGVKNYEHSRIK